MDSSNVESVVEESNHLIFKKLVCQEIDGGDLSVTYVEVAGQHRMLKTDASTRVYYILSGDFIFTIGGEDPIRATQGQVVVIYRSSEYGFTGDGQYLVMNGPAFQEGDDLYVGSGTLDSRE